MGSLRYILVESIYDTRTTYGIALADCADEYPVIIEVFPDLSSDKERVKDFVKLCGELELAPLHLSDAVYDFLAE